MRLALLGNPDNIHVQRWARFLHGRGHEILVIADPHTRTKLDNIKTVQPRWNFCTNLLAFKLTPKPHGNSIFKPIHYRPLIRQFRPDVVHGFEAYYNGLATAWAGDYPKVLTPWGFDVHRDGLRGGLYTWIVKTSLRGADRISTNDESLPNFLAEHYGIDPARVAPFSWGVDLATFHPNYKPEADRWRAELNIPLDAPVIFSPRAFDPGWGAETIVESIPHVIQSVPNAVFVILASAGPHDFRERMMRRVRELGLDPAVRWIEKWLVPAEMAALFNLASAFVSIPQSDLLALTVIEGMACGCVPVLAPIRSYRKHARAGENSLILDNPNPHTLAAALVQVLAKHEFRQSASADCAARMRLHEDASKNMAQMEEVYAGAIEAHGLQT